MKLREVFDQLTYGELSQLGLVNQSTGQIEPVKYPQLVSHINLGLTDLFKRFKLKEGRVSMPLVAGQLEYRAKSTEVLKIEQVFTAYGKELALNKGGDPFSCHMPTLTSLRVPASIVNQTEEVPEELRTSSLVIVFRANHRKLVATLDEDIDPDETELELPQTHMQALLLFVASRVHNPIGMVNEFNAGNNYAAKYEAEVMSLKNDGLQVDNQAETTRFERGGWV